MGSLKLRPCRIDQVIARSIWQEDQMFEVNKLNVYYIRWILVCLCRPMIGSQALQENNALELANQSARYIGYKHEPCDKKCIF